MNVTGLVGVKRLSGSVMLIPQRKFVSGSSTSNCGGVGALKVTDTVTVALVPGVNETDDGDTWIVHGAACVTLTENVAV